MTEVSHHRALRPLTASINDNDEHVSRQDLSERAYGRIYEE